MVVLVVAEVAQVVAEVAPVVAEVVVDYAEVVADDAEVVVDDAEVVAFVVVDDVVLLLHDNGGEYVKLQHQLPFESLIIPRQHLD